MQTLSTTRLSSKGQVVIPEEIRNTLKLQTGAQFVVLGSDDTVIFKKISEPSMEDFDEMIAKAEKQVRLLGIKRRDVLAAIRKVRNQK